MKIDNLKRAVQLTAQLTSVETALLDIEVFLNIKTKEIFGYESGSANTIYSFHMSECDDGSGLQIKLTNCAIAIETVKFAKTLLEKRKAVVVKEIESL